jgi:hypothetical protein
MKNNVIMIFVQYIQKSGFERRPYA